MARRFGASGLDLDLDDPEPVDMDTLFRADEDRRARLAARNNGLDTGAALEAAAARYDGILDVVLGGARARIKAAAPAFQFGWASDVCDGPIKLWEQHARLDLRVLVREGLFRPGEESGFVLDWRSCPTALDEVVGFVDLVDPDIPSLWLECFQQEDATYQRLELMRTGGSRPSWKAVCPVTRDAGFLFAFREARFASRKAQRLVNQSQRLAGGWTEQRGQRRAS